MINTWSKKGIDGKFLRNGKFIQCKICRKEFYIWSKQKRIYCSLICRNNDQEWKEKVVLSRVGKMAHGTGHFRFKKEGYGYRTAHYWVERRLGKPRKCEHCGITTLRHRQYHWANKSKKYLRDLDDWIRLCIPCHMRFDGRTKKI